MNPDPLRVQLTLTTSAFLPPAPRLIASHFPTSSRHFGHSPAFTRRIAPLHLEFSGGISPWCLRAGRPGSLAPSLLRAGLPTWATTGKALLARLPPGYTWVREKLAYR